MKVARAFAYTWFAATAGLFVAGVLTFWLATTSAVRGGLPGDGGVFWIVCSLFIAMALFFENWDQFGKPVRLRWISLCALATLLAGVGLVAGLLSNL